MRAGWVFSLLAIGMASGACAPSRATRALEPQATATIPPARAPETLTAPSSASGDGGDAFTTSVRPMLAVRCAPCHIPGGKMYERLPFDDPQVVKTHKEGILKRLKGEDHASLESWITSSK